MSSICTSAKYELQLQNAIVHIAQVLFHYLPSINKQIFQVIQHCLLYSLHKFVHVLKARCRRENCIFLIQAHRISWLYSCCIALTANHMMSIQQIKKRGNGIILSETSEVSRQTGNCPSFDFLDSVLIEKSPTLHIIENPQQNKTKIIHCHPKFGQCVKAVLTPGMLPEKSWTL